MRKIVVHVDRSKGHGFGGMHDTWVSEYGNRLLRSRLVFSVSRKAWQAVRKREYVSMANIFGSETTYVSTATTCRCMATSFIVASRSNPC